MPQINQNTLDFFIEFLGDVIKFEKVNKMKVQSVVAALLPYIFRTNCVDNAIFYTVVTTMIQQRTNIFKG